MRPLDEWGYLLGFAFLATVESLLYVIALVIIRNREQVSAATFGSMATLAWFAGAWCSPKPTLGRGYAWCSLALVVPCAFEWVLEGVVPACLLAAIALAFFPVLFFLRPRR